MAIVHSWAVTSRQVTWWVILSWWLWMCSHTWSDFWVLAYWSTLLLIPAKNCIFREEECPWKTFQACNQHFNALYTMWSKRERLDMLVLSFLLATKGFLNIFWKCREITFIQAQKCLKKISKTLPGKDLPEIDYLIFRKTSIISLNHIIISLNHIIIRKYIYQTHIQQSHWYFIMTH